MADKEKNNSKPKVNNAKKVSKKTVVKTKKNDTKKIVKQESNVSKKNVQNSKKKVTNKTKTDVKSKSKDSVIVKDVTLTDVFKKTETSIVDKKTTNNKEKIENNINVVKIEDAKHLTKRNKKLLLIGVFIVVLGVVSLLISILSNRIIDRNVLSDTTVTVMLSASIIIEGFGAFIIINES